MSHDLSQLPLMIEPEQLAEVLNHPDLLILDLSQPQSYRHGHVPGAVFLPFQQLMGGQAPAPGLLPSADHLSELFSALGLKENSFVVAYDDEGGGWAGRLIWTLDMMGHQHYACINGGIHGWRDAGLPEDTDLVQPAPSPYQAQIVGRASVTKDWLLEHLNDDDLVIWDARSPQEYEGIRVNAARGGHIPGAVNYEWTRAMDPLRSLRLRDLNQIREELSQLGISPEKQIVTHCQTHHRSGFTYLLGKVLGFPSIKAYPGSWSEWGNAEDTPIAR